MICDHWFSPVFNVCSLILQLFAGLYTIGNFMAIGRFVKTKKYILTFTLLQYLVSHGSYETAPNNVCQDKGETEMINLYPILVTHPPRWNDTF